MSTKTTSKTKKDRPKSTDKLPRGKRGQTPDQGTDSEGRGEDDGKQIKTIINDEILSLQIKPEDLDKLREELSPDPDAVKQTVTVKKLRSPSQIPPKTLPVKIAKPAPRDAPLKKINYNAFEVSKVPRVESDGRIVAHSLLGSIEEYMNQAEKHNKLPESFVPINEERRGTLSLFHKERREEQFPQYTSADESSALKNWEKHMAERREQQERLAKRVNKHPSQLVMNESESYRLMVERRHLIDRTLHVYENGKGYRTGSEYWAQPEVIGDEDDGLRLTLNQTKKGYPPPIEHVGNTQVAMLEKGLLNWGDPPTDFLKPWHHGDYLKMREWQLAGVIRELDPHHPEFQQLEVVGQSISTTSHDEDDEDDDENEEEEDEKGDEEKAESEDYADEYNKVTDIHDAELRNNLDQDEDKPEDPFAALPDVEPEQVIGPSLLFTGQAARWTGDSHSFSGQIGIDARVSFEIYAGRRIVSFLDIMNDGTTAVQYTWKKVHRPNPFQLQHNNVQRFYFNTTDGTILPGESTRIPFVFKSPTAGVFQEQWQLITKPVLCGGAKLLVTLRGIALQQDVHGLDRTHVENSLQRRQAMQIAREILDELVVNIKESARPSSPVDAYVTEEERFLLENPSLCYHYERVQELRSIFTTLTPDETSYEWDFSVDTIQRMIMEIDEDDEEKQDYLERFNNIVTEINFPLIPYEDQDLYSIGYQVLCEYADRFVNQAVALQQLLGLPEREGSELPIDLKKKSSLTKGNVTNNNKRPSMKVAPSKSTTAAVSSAVVMSVSSTNSKTALSKVTVAMPEASRESAIEDTAIESKYKDALYFQGYMFLSEALDNMVQMFQEKEQKWGGPALPKMIPDL